jgi:hypothetical protein
MATDPKPKTGFEKWQDGINKAVGNPKWDIYDCEIRSAVNEFNAHLLGQASFRSVEWQLIKAMVWIETGADKDLWKSNPMQIGMYNDPGLRALLSGKEGGELILPKNWLPKLTTSSARAIPAHNIRAGIGYLLMRLASFATKSVFDTDTQIYEVTIKPNDSFEKIAKAQGSTVIVMKNLNPAVTTLFPGKVLKYQKASMKKLIISWKPVTTANIAAYYNSGGDKLYAKKLDYALSLVRKGKEAVCQ